MILSSFEKVFSLPTSFRYLLFKMVETDMDFAQAEFLLKEIYQRKIYQDPAKIELVQTISFPQVKEIHFNQWWQKEKISLATNSQLEENDQRDFADYQTGLENYLENLLTQANTLLAEQKKEKASSLIKTPFSQQLWLQIEDDTKRHFFHFQMLKVYVLSSLNPAALLPLVNDFIAEMALFENEPLLREGKELLETIKLAN